MITSLTYLISKLHFAEISFWILAGNGGGGEVNWQVIIPISDTSHQKCSINYRHILPENVQSERRYMILRKRDDLLLNCWLCN